MPALNSETWAQIRAEREAGATLRELQGKYNVSTVSIHHRAKREGWMQVDDLDDQIKRKTSEKLIGLPHDVSPEDRAKTVNELAEKHAAILKNHQMEPESARERIIAGIVAHKIADEDMDLHEVKLRKQIAFEDLKAAKIAAEALSIVQAMERKAYNLDTNTKQEVIISNPRAKKR